MDRSNAGGVEDGARWRNRPPGSTWGDFGPDDELGRLNLLTPERVRTAAEEIREGVRFCLSLPLDLPGGNALVQARRPPRLRPTGPSHAPVMNFEMKHVHADATDVVCDDVVELWLQYSTQWDSLAHVGQLFDAVGAGAPERLYYNGWKASEHVVSPLEATEARPPGAHRMSVATMAEAAIQGRGVMVDLRKHLGDERVLVGAETLRRILEADRVVVEPGDIVCLYTGFADLILEMEGRPDVERLDRSCAVLDGRDPDLLAWISQSGLSALVADNFAVEAHPAREPCCSGAHAVLPLHDHCLFRLGVPLGELWWLGDLAQALRSRSRSRFFLTAPPLRLPRAVGSPVTPVATI